MEAAPPDKASMDPSVATNVRVEEDRVRLDGTSSTEEQYKQNLPRNEKSTYGIKWTASEYPKDF